MRKNCVDMCAKDGRGAIGICLSEKWALAKKRLGNTGLEYFSISVSASTSNEKERIYIKGHHSTGATDVWEKMPPTCPLGSALAWIIVDSRFDICFSTKTCWRKNPMTLRCFDPEPFKSLYFSCNTVIYTVYIVMRSKCNVVCSKTMSKRDIYVYRVLHIVVH